MFVMHHDRHLLGTAALSPVTVNDQVSPGPRRLIGLAAETALSTLALLFKEFSCAHCRPYFRSVTYSDLVALPASWHVFNL